MPKVEKGGLSVRTIENQIFFFLGMNDLLTSKQVRSILGIEPGTPRMSLFTEAWNCLEETRPTIKSACSPKYGDLRFWYFLKIYERRLVDEGLLHEEGKQMVVGMSVLGRQINKEQLRNIGILTKAQKNEIENEYAKKLRQYAEQMRKKAARHE